MNDTIAMILHTLYEGFGPEETGEDYALGAPEYDRAIAADMAGYWHEVNEARRALDIVEYDGLLMEAVLKARGQADPNLLADSLLEVAAVAISYANSTQRQTNALNAEKEAKPTRKGKGEGE